MEEQHFTKTDIEDAKKFGEFFIDLMDNHKETLMLYLSEHALLDWFGHTVKGTKTIRSYFQYKAGTYKHNMSTPTPVRTIGYRESHQIKFDSTPRKTTCDTLPRNKNNEVTPPKCTTPPPQTYIGEQGQGDGPHNNNYTTPKSPTKRRRIDTGQGDYSVSPPSPPPQIRYFTTKGTIEFCRRSRKKLQTETKWNRPCTLEVAYSGDTFENCVVYMIIYKGNMKCRRNLLKEFEASV